MSPTINLNNKRVYQPMTVNTKARHKWYNCRKWRKLRAAKFKSNPLCEECIKNNVVKQTEEVHHIIPIDIEHPDINMIYDWDNLQSLCIECHSIEHTTDKRIKDEARKRL